MRILNKPFSSQIIWGFDIVREVLLESWGRGSLPLQWKINQVSGFRFRSSWKIQRSFVVLREIQNILDLSLPSVQGTPCDWVRAMGSYSPGLHPEMAQCLLLISLNHSDLPSYFSIESWPKLKVITRSKNSFFFYCILNFTFCQEYWIGITLFLAHNPSILCFYNFWTTYYSVRSLG